MAGLAVGDVLEERRDVWVTLDVCLLCEPQVTAVGLALAGERLLEILMSLGAVKACHDVLLSVLGLVY